jgi:hypothetical protein
MCLLSSPAQQTLGHIECCAVKKWPQSKSCGAAFGWALDGRIGPFMSIDTKGGNRTFAALCIEVCYAGL